MDPIQNKFGRTFSGFLLCCFVALVLVTLFASNSVLSENIVGTIDTNISVTEDVYVPDTYDYLQEINLTTHRIEFNVSYLFERENCTRNNHIAEVGTKCWYLDLLNSTLKAMNITLQQINATAGSLNSTSSLTNKLIGNVLTSFGKNLYVVSGNPSTLDENLSGSEGKTEVHVAGDSKMFYFYLEQVPFDNLTVEIYTSNYTPSGTTPKANVSLWINNNQIFNNWTFSGNSGQHIIANVSIGQVQTGENTFNLTTYGNSVAYDYVVIFTQNSLSRLARAIEYNQSTGGVLEYLQNTIYPYLQGMNENITNVLNDTAWLYNNLNCTVTVDTDNQSICTRLSYIYNFTQFLRANVTLMGEWVLSTNDTLVNHILGTNSTIHSRLTGMNNTIERIVVIAGDIRNMTNCTTSGAGTVLCSKLDNITAQVVVVNSTVNTIKTYVTEINTTTHWIWDIWKRKNDDVVRFENMTGRFLSGTANITIFYNITIPTKQGFDGNDYLPIRWKFWFLRWEKEDSYMNQTCINQNREFQNVEPYCNPLIAQYIGRPTYNYTLNISLRPSLDIGNYTVIREIEIDPEYVWVTHGRGPIGTIEVTAETYDEMDGTGDGAVAADKDTNYIDNDKTDEKFNKKLPTPTILTLKGEKNLLHGSIKIVITDTFTPIVTWNQLFNDAITNGVYEFKLGEEKTLNLVQGKEYQMEVTICDGPVFDESKYKCETETTTFTG